MIGTSWQAGTLCSNVVRLDGDLLGQLALNTKIPVLYVALGQAVGQGPGDAAPILERWIFVGQCTCKRRHPIVPEKHGGISIRRRPPVKIYSRLLTIGFVESVPISDRWIISDGIAGPNDGLAV